MLLSGLPLHPGAPVFCGPFLHRTNISLFPPQRKSPSRPGPGRRTWWQPPNSAPLSRTGRDSSGLGPTESLGVWPALTGLPGGQCQARPTVLMVQCMRGSCQGDSMEPSRGQDLLPRSHFGLNGNIQTLSPNANTASEAVAPMRPWTAGRTWCCSHFLSLAPEGPWPLASVRNLSMLCVCIWGCGREGPIPVALMTPGALTSCHLWVLLRTDITRQPACPAGVPGGADRIHVSMGLPVAKTWEPAEAWAC